VPLDAGLAKTNRRINGNPREQLFPGHGRVPRVILPWKVSPSKPHGETTLPEREGRPVLVSEGSRIRVDRVFVYFDWKRAAADRRLISERFQLSIKSRITLFSLAGRFGEVSPGRVQLPVCPRQVGKRTLPLELQRRFGGWAISAAVDGPVAPVPAPVGG
jgi:hypothetical protein